MGKYFLSSIIDKLKLQKIYNTNNEECNTSSCKGDKKEKKKKKIQHHLTLLETIVPRSYRIGTTFRGKRKRTPGFSETQKDFNYTRS